MLIPRFAIRMLSVALMVLGIDVVSGQDYPNKPIRIVISNAGSGNDFVSRQIASGISGPLGQPVIVDNRASGAIAAEVVSKAPPDGYTLTVQGAPFWISRILRKTPYDVERDFSPISLISMQPLVVAIHPSMPVKSVKELIALAKAKPGELNYASPGLATTPHLAMELFKSMAGVNIVHVPYKGGVAQTTAVIAGEAQLLILDAGLLAPHVKSGKLRALAVTSAEPSALSPGLSTMAASGLPGFEVIGMTAIFASGKTPRAIINRLNQETVRVLNLPDVKERFLNAGEEIVASSPEQLAARIKSETPKWRKVIEDARIKPD